MSIPVWVKCDVCNWIFELKFDFAPCRTPGCTKGLLLRSAKENEKYVRVECSVRVHYNRVPVDAQMTKCYCCSEEFEIGNDVVEVRSKQNIYGSKRIEVSKEAVEQKEMPSEERQNDDNKIVSVPVQKSPAIEDKMKLDKEIDDLKGKLLDLHKQLAEKRVESKGSAVNSRKDAEKIVKLQDEVKRTTEENRKLTERVVKLNFEKICWDRKVEMAEAERTRMEGKLLPITTENNLLKYEVMCLQNKMKVYERDLKLEEAAKKDLETEVESLKKMFENCKEELIGSGEETEELKKENTTLTFKIAELNMDVANEKTMNSNLRQSIIQLKQELSQLENDKKQMSEQIEMEKMIEELKLALEMNKEHSKQESAKTVEEMKAQINSLTEANLNLSTALAKVDVKNAENQTNKVGPWLVPCDVCGVKETIPKDHWATHCKEESCSGNVTIICAPVRDGYRIVRHKCKNLEYYNLIPYEEKTLECTCCQREFKITNIVTEVRNKQKVFRAELEVLPEEEIADLKNKIEEMQKSHEHELKRKEEIILSIPNEHKKNYEEHMKHVYALINENKRLNEEVRHKKKIQRELDVEQFNVANLTKINTMLMKKIAGFEKAAK